jgi:hypothetical protein
MYRAHASKDKKAEILIAKRLKKAERIAHNVSFC